MINGSPFFNRVTPSECVMGTRLSLLEETLRFWFALVSGYGSPPIRWEPKERAAPLGVSSSNLRPETVNGSEESVNWPIRVNDLLTCVTKMLFWFRVGGSVITSTTQPNSSQQNQSPVVTQWRPLKVSWSLWQWQQISRWHSLHLPQEEQFSTDHLCCMPKTTIHFPSWETCSNPRKPSRK